MAVLLPIRPATVFLLCLLATLFFPSSSAQRSCNSHTFSNNRRYRHCTSLPRLHSSLHWTYHPAAGTVDLAFRSEQGRNGWVAWAINPAGSGMVGAQALVAFPNSTTGSVTAYTTQVNSFSPSMRPAALSFPVTRLEAEYDGGGDVMTIFATVAMPGNGTTVNHVWQASTSFSPDGFPEGHPISGDNLLSFGSLDLLSGQKKKKN